MMGISLTTTLIGAVALLGVVGIGIGILFYYRYRQALDQQLQTAFADEETLAFSPPEMTLTPLDYFRAMRHLQVQRRAAKQGYVKWYRLGSNWERPRWVKPEQDGSGMRKITRDGQPYYFDEDAMTVDSQSGAWVAVHRVGEADPINLSDPAYPGIETDLMERIINLETESKPPGLLDNLFGAGQQTLMYGGIALLFLVFAVYRYMGGA